MDNFDIGRIYGETILNIALAKQIIANDGFSELISPDNYTKIKNTNTKTTKFEAAIINKKNGDFSVVYNYINEFIDAKNGNWISEPSLSGIRDGAYIAFNMKTGIPFIIKLTFELKLFIRTNIEASVRTKNEPGFTILLDSLPKNIIFMEFNVDEFIKMRDQIMPILNKIVKIKSTFNEYNYVLKKQTQFSSSLNKESYNSIINLGKDVIPLIIDDLIKTDSHWFYALSEIANFNPVQEKHQGIIPLMKKDWIEWAKQNNFYDEMILY